MRTESNTALSVVLARKLKSMLQQPCRLQGTDETWAVTTRPVCNHMCLAAVWVDANGIWAGGLKKRGAAAHGWIQSQ